MFNVAVNKCHAHRRREALFAASPTKARAGERNGGQRGDGRGRRQCRGGEGAARPVPEAAGPGTSASPPQPLVSPSVGAPYAPLPLLCCPRVPAGIVCVPCPPCTAPTFPVRLVHRGRFAPPSWGGVWSVFTKCDLVPRFVGKVQLFPAQVPAPGHILPPNGHRCTFTPDFFKNFRDLWRGSGPPTC